MTTPEPTVIISQYTVSCLPIDHPERRYFEMYVSQRRNRGWYVMDGFYYFTPTGESTREPSPMPQGEALELAKRLAVLMTINGWTVADVLTRGGAE